jgi:signal transduction histidine kinase
VSSEQLVAREDGSVAGPTIDVRQGHARTQWDRGWAGAAIDGVLILVALADALLSLDQATPPETAVSIVAVAGIALRRRWPLLTLALALPGLYLAEAGVAAVVGVYAVASTSRRAWPVIAASALAFAGFLTAAVGEIAPAQWVITVIYSVLFAVGPAALGLLAAARRQLRIQLEELRIRRWDDQRRAAREALARERAMLAREMHDVVSHQVGLIAVQAGALQVTSKDELARETAQVIRELSVTTLNELRTMVGVLRSGGDDIELPGLDPSIDDLRALVEQGAAQVDAELDLPQGVPLATRRAVYRTLQEALTNARKHAPGEALDIRLGSDGDRIELTVRNGVRSGGSPGGPTLPGGRVGLIGLTERAELLGGTFTARVYDEQFVLRLVIPG